LQETEDSISCAADVGQEDEFIILGHTAPSGARKYFGVLLLGAFKNGKLQYVGRVGTGFPRDVLASLYRKFQLLKRKQPSVEDLPRTQRATFLSPKLVAQISYTEWAKDGRLRHPVFLGLRHDKMLKMLRCLRPNENQMAKKFPVAVSHGDRVFGIVPIQGQCLQRW
jgi:ATP-dependent DNA ligase